MQRRDVWKISLGMSLMPVELTAEQLDKVVEKAIADIEKEHGKGSIFSMADKVGIPWPHIPTGVPQIDHDVLGIGGFPLGRIVEVFGPESCLDKDTFIQFDVRTKTGDRINHKGGAIERLYERFHGLKRHHLERADVNFFAPSVNEEGRIFQNQVVDVIKTGFKECFGIETETGQTIQATAEHKFYSEGKYVPLSELRPGSVISVHNCTPFKTEFEKRAERSFVYVKSHGTAGTKTINHKYVYYRVPRARAVIEAAMNGLSFSDYLERLNTGDIEGIEFLDRNDHVHHIDEDHRNDRIENLLVMSASEHGVLHATERHNNLRYTIVDSVVKSITPVGVKETYDLRMLSPFNNYVANEFVVHNSGKTTLALTVVASAQKNGGRCAYVDVENALDPTYMSKLGVDVESLLVSQPDYGEQALDIVIALVDTGAFSVIVVDSVAALVPKAELDGDMTDQLVGVQARLMSKAMRKLTNSVSKANVCLIFINQIREKIGVMFGSPETTSGGRALRFFASVRLDIRRISQIKKGEVKVGNNTKIKAVKNKMAPPFKEVEVPILFGKGFDIFGSTIDKWIAEGRIVKSGSWFSYREDRLGQGRDNVVALLEENKELFERIKNGS